MYSIIYIFPHFRCKIAVRRAVSLNSIGRLREDHPSSFSSVLSGLSTSPADPDCHLLVGWTAAF